MTNLFAQYKNLIYEQLDILIDPKEFEIPKGDPILVNITNISQWYWNQPKAVYKAEEFIDRLPWELCWFEYTDPNTILDEEGKKVKATVRGRTWGCLSYPKGDFNCLHLFLESEGFERSFPSIVYLGSWKGRRDHKGFAEMRLTGWGKAAISSAGSNKQTDSEKFSNFFSVVRLAMTFSHCKNVDYYERSHPPKLQKANIKRGKIPQETYKVLDIGGLVRQAKEQSNREGRSERAQALHICRGHFKTYTEENPLFGKHTGTYWCPMHKRGSSEHGKVNKDYRIKKPD